MAVKCFIRKAGRGNRVTLYALAQQSYSGETPGTAGEPGHRGSQGLDTSPQHKHTPMCKSAQRLTHVHGDRHTGAQVGICLLADFQIAALGQRVLGHFPQGKMLWAFPAALYSLFRSAKRSPVKSTLAGPHPLLPNCLGLFHPWH